MNGDLLDHISTGDTARDLDALRKAVGDRLLTYVGLSYGSMIGQTYANLFPGRVRAMMLDGIVDAVNYTTSAETRTAGDVASTDEVFDQFMALCQRAGPAGCALAGHGEPVAQRVAKLFAQASRSPIPAPNADPPGELTSRDLQVSTFTPLRLPLTWPQFATDLEAAINGDATNLKIAAQAQQTPEGFADVHDLRRDLVRRRPCPPAGQRVAGGHRPLHRREHALGTEERMGVLGSVRVGLAGARPPAIRGAVERDHEDPDLVGQRSV